MMWRSMDPAAPGLQAGGRGLRGHRQDVYEQFDRIVGETLPRVEAGATAGRDVGPRLHELAARLPPQHLAEGERLPDRPSIPHLKDDPGLFSNVDWSRTRAYAPGAERALHQRGGPREVRHRGPRRARGAGPARSRAKLLQTVDPTTGERAVTKVLRREEYRDRGHLEIGPDLVVGYAKGMRGSDESALGKLDARGRDRQHRRTGAATTAWTTSAVPGVLFASRPLSRPAAKLEELAAAILAEFGVEGFPNRPAATSAEAALTSTVHPPPDVGRDRVRGKNNVRLQQGQDRQGPDGQGEAVRQDRRLLLSGGVRRPTRWRRSWPSSRAPTPRRRSRSACAGSATSRERRQRRSCGRSSTSLLLPFRVPAAHRGPAGGVAGRGRSACCSSSRGPRTRRSSRP